MAKITKEEKMADIQEAKKCFEEATKLIEKGEKLIKKNMRGVEICAGKGYPPLGLSDYEGYCGLIEVHLFSGITKLERLLDVKGEAEKDWQGREDDSRRVFCVEGIKFFQIGDAVKQARTVYKFK